MTDALPVTSVPRRRRFRIAFWIVTTIVLLALAFPCIQIYSDYQRELRITKTLWNLGGLTFRTYEGPRWIPDPVQEYLFFYWKVTGVEFDGTMSLMADSAKYPDVTLSDNDLPVLEGLRNLQSLNLGKTQITDAGLVHLEKLTWLKFIELDNTETTDEGRVQLQQALPNCVVSGGGPPVVGNATPLFAEPDETTFQPTFVPSPDDK